MVGSKAFADSRRMRCRRFRKAPWQSSTSSLTVAWIGVILAFLSGPTAWGQSCPIQLVFTLSNGQSPVVGTASQVCSAQNSVNNSNPFHISSGTYTPTPGTPDLPTPGHLGGSCDAVFVVIQTVGPGCQGLCQSTITTQSIPNIDGLNPVMAASTYCPSAHAVADAKKRDQNNCCNPQHDPINPATGAMFLTETDVPDPNGVLRFLRYYNSANSTDSDAIALGGPGAVYLSPGWRYSFTRRIDLVPSQSLSADPTDVLTESSGYSNEASACTLGFAEIKGSVSAWANATAAYDGRACNLSVGGTSIGQLPIVWDNHPPGSADVMGWDATRDDGQRIRFTFDGVTIKAPPGSAMRLQQNASGFTLIDETDNVEQYDISGRLQSVTNRAGVTVSVTYDSSGRLAGATDSFGHHISISVSFRQRCLTAGSRSWRAARSRLSSQGGREGT
jgi:YD repeat-containing protein